MIVGEPSLMGGEMDDEDERYITRLENTQFDSKSIKQEQTSLESTTNQVRFLSFFLYLKILF